MSRATSRAAPSTNDAPAGSGPGSAGGPDQPRHRYTADLARDLEIAWQDRWDEEGTFDAPNPLGVLSEGFAAVADRPHLFVMDMFPYPSGAGLHVGHPLGYIGTDVYARFKRMSGTNVLYTLGYDAFGLPAEQHAIATGIHPRVNTEANIVNMRRQLRRLGLSHDRRRSVATTDAGYYHWTQWIFLQIFNAFYDHEADRARPIAELEAEFEAGTRPVPGGRAWADLDPVERRDVVDAHRLAYLADAPVNWCPGLGTILANEEVTSEGRSDIGNFPVFKRNMRQWMLRITAYADRLLADLDRLDWPEPIKVMQRNWIGRSEGATVAFPSVAGPIEVFTTRPDTLFGATFMVLAPEHPLVPALTDSRRSVEVETYRRQAAERSELQRQEEGRDKTGVFLGTYATNPVTGRDIPIWIADYVLTGYGTGAIMAVPSGDQRDFEFARRYGLPIVATQLPPHAWFDQHGIAASTDCATWPEAYIGEGVYVNSARDDLVLDGERTMAEAKSLINTWLAAKGFGEATVTYKLRDWLFSRQRYWGEPFPIVYDGTGRPLALPSSALPVELPDLDDFKPEALDPNDDTSAPLPPLARAETWLEVTLDLGDGPARYRRELNVMPQWAGSCWYELRYLDPTNEDRLVDPEIERYWMGPRPGADTGGVDLYVGGVEHAVLHLLYARFWHKVLYDLGVVSSEEPFHRLFNQGYIQAYAYRDRRGQVVEAADVGERDGGWWLGDEPVEREYGKMGKSLRNVVTPDDMYDAYGADTFRLYEMAMGPLDVSRPWNTRDVVGMQRFLQRVWRVLIDEDTGGLRDVHHEPSGDDLRVLHRTIDGVRADMDGLRFNTAIAKLIELTNHLMKSGAAPRAVVEPLVLMLAPLAPHLAEELWQRLGHTGSLAWEPFPEADPALLVESSVEVGVSVNGKPRGRVRVAADADQATLEAAARAEPKVAALLDGKPVRKVVVVPGRLVNFVLADAVSRSGHPAERNAYQTARSDRPPGEVEEGDLMVQAVADPDRDDLPPKARFDDRFDVWTAPAHLEAHRRTHRQLAGWTAGVDHLLVRATSPRPGERVLDLASGTGLPALTMASLVGPSGTVVALDRSADLLRIAAEEAARLELTNLHVQEADAHDLPWPDGSFDLVTCRYGVSWFHDPRRALSEARRVLRPGGRVGFVVNGSPNQPMLNAFDGTVRRSLGLRWPDPDQPSPARHSRAGTLRDDLRATGFSHVRERSERVEGCWSGSGAQVWQLAATRLEPELAGLTVERRRSLGRTVVASLERRRRGTVLHLPIHVHLATATRA